jgi:acyl-CoA dehydrogenase
MDFSFTEEAEAVHQLAEQVFRGSMSVERVKEIEASDDRIDRALWKELATTGLLGIGLPEAHGGAGLGLVEVCLTLIAQARQVAPVPLWPTVVTAQTLADLGTAEQQERWLPAVASGDAVLTVALEHGPRREPRTVDGDRLTGDWTSVPALHVADAVLVFIDGDGYLVETGADGVSFDVATTTSRQKVGHLHLEAAPATALGDGARTYAHDRALVALAALAKNGAGRVFEQLRRRFIAAIQAEGVAMDAGFRGFARRTNQRCRVVGELVNAQRAAAGSSPLPPIRPRRPSGCAHWQARLRASRRRGATT